MTNTDREFVALTAYLKLMSNKGADHANLDQRKNFLLRLIPLLAEQLQDSEVYRSHVDKLLQECEKSTRPFLMNVALEYQRFWVNDIKAIAALHASGGYDIAPVVAPVPTENLKTLWKNLDKEQFSVTEKWPLMAYASALREEGAEQEVVETRSRLVKLLLLRLREVECKDGDHYRVAVHATLPLFVMKDTRHMFLMVVREFYYFWIGDPGAAKYLVLKGQAWGRLPPNL